MDPFDTNLKQKYDDLEYSFNKLIYSFSKVIDGQVSNFKKNFKLIISCRLK